MARDIHALVEAVNACGASVRRLPDGKFTLEREIVVLRELVAGIKVQKHEVEAQLSRLKEEAAAMRAALGSEEKP